eukprot:14324209-Alexandrium_andersonii.AAC.1
MKRASPFLAHLHPHPPGTVCGTGADRVIVVSSRVFCPRGYQQCQGGISGGLRGGIGRSNVVGPTHV